MKDRFDQARLPGNEERAEEIRQILEEAKELGLGQAFIDLSIEEILKVYETL